ncbi:hypothetical protein V6N13_099535 [Hibiscus sabdariffa]|uniref:Mitochondrial import inner membrane translocase subunit TIM50 n=1 Tax=Hibiscus sabdariffa TaxID=183260 RepID=A0ABR2Q004_9ROSI
MNFYVLKGSEVDFFLEEINKKHEVVIFTAGLKEVNGKFVKDLSVMGTDLGRVVIDDDNPNAYSLQSENVIHMRPFVEDSEDRELEKLARFFEWCERFEDMRVAVKQCFNGNGCAGDYGFVQLKL